MIITPPLEELLEQQQQELASLQQQSNCLRLSAASEASEAPSEASYASEASTIAAAAAAAATPAGKLRRYRGDTSKRRKGVYITQWPEPASDELRSKLSGQSSEERDEPPPSATPSDLSDCEGQAGPRRSAHSLSCARHTHARFIFDYIAYIRIVRCFSSLYNNLLLARL